MIVEEEAKNLVTSYIRAWHDRWKSVDAIDSRIDLRRWQQLIDELDEANFVPGASSGSSSGYGTPPDHDPVTEHVSGFVAEEGGVARVETVTDGFVKSFWEYEVVASAGGLRLAKIRRFFAAKGTPVVDPSRIDGILAASKRDAPLEELPRGVEPNGDVLFEEGRTFEVGGEAHRVVVRKLGELATRSGVLSVLDFGYDAHDLAAFTRRVSPGRYPVDAAILAGRIAALRVRFSNAPVATWHPATRGEYGHIVGVDAGNVALFDVSSFAHLEEWNKARLFERHVVEVERPRASLVTLWEPNDGVIADSGVGDGSYPCYWGVDAEGRTARLLVDFLMAATFHEDSTGYRNG